MIRFIYYFFWRIYLLSKRLWRPIRVRKNRLFKFILPNLGKIIEGEIKYETYPVCIQKLFIRGEGEVHLGSNCKFGYKFGGGYFSGVCELQPRFKNSKIIINNNISTNNNIIICAANRIEIGEDTLIGRGVTIMDHEAHGIKADNRRQLGEIGQVIIGKNVWLGNNVTILKNSEIGENSIVALGAVVAGKFPSNVIIGGIPARIIKTLPKPHD